MKPQVLETSLLPVNQAYSTKFKINGKECFLFLDTGSSTLIYPSQVYNPASATGEQLPNVPTYNYCHKVQQIIYGDSQQSGALVRKNVGLGKFNFCGTVCAGLYGQVSCQGGGMCGLAFTGFNNSLKKSCRTFTDLLENESCANCDGSCPEKDFWENDTFDYSKTYPTFMDYIGEKYGREYQKFGFYARNVTINYDDTGSIENRGYLVLGGGEGCKQFYYGKLVTIPLQSLNGYYAYQVNLKNMGFVGKNNFNLPIPKSENIPKNTIPSKLGFVPNIIDSGTTNNVTLLTEESYKKVRQYFLDLQIKMGNGELFFEKYNIDEFLNDDLPENIEKDDIVFGEWPKQYFDLVGKKGKLHRFYTPPEKYFAYIGGGQYQFFLQLTNKGYFSGSNKVDSCVIGLTFLTANYCVFDYGNKLVKIAPKK